MDPDVKIHLATSEDAEVIAAMAVALTDEIIMRTDTPHFDIDQNRITSLCHEYLTNGIYRVLLACETETSETVGFAALCESHALYTDGPFGIVQEFYVDPKARSLGLGALIIDQATTLARELGWRRLELCTPPLPEFVRTVAFYEANGLEVTGGLKMKLALCALRGSGRR